MSRALFVIIGSISIFAIILLTARSFQHDLQSEVTHFIQKGSHALCASTQQLALTTTPSQDDNATCPTITCPIAPEPIDTRLKVLHLIDEPTMQALMDRWFMRSHLAFAAQTDLISDAPMYGPGFEGWNERKTIKENIVGRYGRADYFDAIMAYFNTDQMQDLGIDPDPYWRELEEVSKTGTVIIDRPHEMRDDRRVTHIARSNTTLVLAPYPSEIIDYQEWTNRALFVHQPHPVDERLFYHPIYHPDGSLVDRPNQVQIAGSLDPAFYPLRIRMVMLAQDGKIQSNVRSHPGYPDTMSDEDRKTHNINAETMDAQMRDYSKGFGDAKVCIVTSSKWMYSIQKYGEAAAAGCLIIGNIPLDRKEDFEQFVVPIDNTMTDAKILETVNWWLANDQARAERAAIGQRYFLERFGSRQYVLDVSSHIRRAKEGQRGMVLPYSWRLLPSPLPNDG